MQKKSLNWAALIVLFTAAASATAQSTFSYQGVLRQGGEPLSGTADLQFRLYSAESGGSQIGSTLTIADVTIVDGLVTAGLDFGAGAFNGSPRWLQVSVRSPSGPGAFTTLTPRQPILPAPYAMFAFSAPSGGGGSLWSANGSNVYYSSGRVGVGTSTPTAPLEVRASVDGRIRIAKIHTGGFGVVGPSVLELQSNFVGSDQPYGSIRFLDGEAAVHARIEYGLAPGLLTPPSMRFVTESQDRLAITNSGNVGIGTTSPQSALHVVGAENSGTNAALRIVSGSQQLLLDGNEVDTNTAVGLYLNNNVPYNVILCNGGGDVGIGTTNPSARLHAYSPAGTGVRGVSNSASAYGGVFGDLSTAGRGVLVVGTSHLLSPVGIGTTSIPANTMLAVEGTARVNVLQIAGADLAEKFPTSEPGTIEPGTVLEIDPDNAGQLRIARGPYNRRVAGVVSGANDFLSGAILGNLPGHEDAPAVALSGRVFVRCDATAGAIQPGDLLTTSSTPGHAMVVRDHARASGAVIGKAMTALEQGERGLVLVLVSLQ